MLCIQMSPGKFKPTAKKYTAYSGLFISCFISPLMLRSQKKIVICFHHFLPFLICLSVCLSVCLSSSHLLDAEDELSDLQADKVPSEVRDWLACTFSRKMGVAKRRAEEKPRFRSIVHAVQAGIFVER